MTDAEIATFARYVNSPIVVVSSPPTPEEIAAARAEVANDSESAYGEGQGGDGLAAFDRIVEALLRRIP